MIEERNRYDDAVDTTDELRAQEQLEEEAREMSALGKVIGVFTSPTKAFTAIRFKHEVIIPLILVPLVGVLYYLLFWDSIAAELIRQMEVQYAEMGIEVMPGMMEATLGMQRIIMPVTIVVMYFVMLLISSVFYLICSAIAKGDLSFGKAWIMSAYVSLITLVTYAIMMIMTAVMGRYDTTMPMTSLVSLIPDVSTQSFTYFATMPIEVISIWSLFVTYFALKAMGRFGKKAATISVVTNFAFGWLLSVGMGMGSMMLLKMAGM